jgi:aminoglycoside phosphotransferase (APT) family kinase protein
MEDKIPQIVEKELNAKVLEIKRINEGYSHHMFDVRIDKEPFEVIVRFQNNEEEKNGLSKENFVINLMASKGLPVPKVYAFYDCKEKFQESYMILEKFKGERLDSLWASLSNGEKNQITEEIGRLLKNIHNIKLENFGNFKADGKILATKDQFHFKKIADIDSDEFIKSTLSGPFEDISVMLSYPSVSKELILRILSYIIRNLKKINYFGKPTLTHGDFLTGHIFVKKNKDRYEIMGLIDFEFAKSSSPEYDFIKLHRTGFFDDLNLKDSLLKGYGSINEESIRIHRILRDIGFARVLLDAGNKELSDKTLESIEKRINLSN